MSSMRGSRVLFRDPSSVQQPPSGHGKASRLLSLIALLWWWTAVMLWWQERSSSSKAPSVAALWGAALLGQAGEVCRVDVKNLLYLSMRIWLWMTQLKKNKNQSSLSLPSTQNRNTREQVTMRLKFRWFRNSDDSEKCQNKDGVMMQSLAGYCSFRRTWIFLIHKMDRGPLSNFVLSAVFNVWCPTYLFCVIQVCLKSHRFLPK